MGLISFNNAIILTGDELDPVSGASLIIEDSRIISIGSPNPRARQIDASGKLICPMFINAHTHLGDTSIKDLGVDLQMEKVLNPPHGLKHQKLNALEENQLISGMRHGLKELLHTGTIACADFREQGLKGVRALRKAAEGLPIHAIILGRMNERADPAACEAEAYAILKEADGLGVRDITSYPIEMLKRIRAAYPEKLFGCHVSEREAAEQESIAETRRGQTARALDWEPDILIHLVHTPQDDLIQAAQQGCFAIACTRSNGILGDGLPNLAKWKRCGVSFGLGTDNMMFCAPNMFREMDTASRTVRGLENSTTCLPAKDILKAATIDGARALRLDKALGSLKPGKEASFIMLDMTSPNLTHVQDVVSGIVHRATPADIDQIYAAGSAI